MTLLERAAETASPQERGQGFAALRRELADVPVERLTQRDLALWGRRLDDLGAEPELRIALAGNVTLDLLAPAVRVLCAREGLLASAHALGIDRYMVDLLAEDGELQRLRPHVVLLVLSLQRLRRDAMERFAALSPAERRALRDDVVGHVTEWVAQARRRLDATLLVANFPAPAYPRLGLADAKEEYGELELHAELGLELLRRLKHEPRVHLFDLDRVTARHGRARARDERLHYLAGTEWSPAFLPELAGEVARHVAAAFRPPRKCLVLDLDDTLWGGVVGEDGPAGLRIGRGDPEGEAYLDFQARVAELARRGVLLAACSRNEPADALAAFAAHPEMPLRPDHFAAMEIGWRPKPEGLRAIAERLGIGLDSLVFVDDNPAEVGLMRRELPAVEALLLPADRSQMVPFLDSLTCFEQPFVLAEDVARSAAYRERAELRQARDGGGDLRAYLHELGTRLTISRLDAKGLARAHQLLQRTNQFNVTTRRYSLGELEGLLADPAWELWSGAVGDRFGELGTVVLALLERRPPVLWVDSFAMSCRAIGRGVETAFMNHLKTRLAALGCDELRGRFRPTTRNVPASAFYPSEGFRHLADEPDGARLYGLARAEAVPRECSWIAVDAAS